MQGKSVCVGVCWPVPFIPLRVLKSECMVYYFQSYRVFVVTFQLGLTTVLFYSAPAVPVIRDNTLQLVGVLLMTWGMQNDIVLEIKDE